MNPIPEGSLIDRSKTEPPSTNHRSSNSNNTNTNTNTNNNNNNNNNHQHRNSLHPPNINTANTTQNLIRDVTCSSPTIEPNKRVAWRKKLVLCLVGLPARGKSYIAYKLVGYLRWRGLQAQLFNVWE